MNDNNAVNTHCLIEVEGRVEPMWLISPYETLFLLDLHCIHSTAFTDKWDAKQQASESVGRQ